MFPLPRCLTSKHICYRDVKGCCFKRDKKFSTAKIIAAAISSAFFEMMNVGLKLKFN